jgi:hypothetical protein
MARVTTLLPRVSFPDFDRWPGFEHTPDPTESDIWINVTMPEGWTTRRQTETGVLLLVDPTQRTRFAALITGLIPVSEEEAGRY